MRRSLPPLAIVLGIAGLIPFAVLGYGAIAGYDDRAAQALAAYGAVILAFLGGVHWGFALPEPSGRGERARLSLGVVPSLIGWVALLLGIAISAEAGLALLLVGFAGLTVVESRATKAGLMPRGYMALRYGLSAGVMTVLCVVLLMRLLRLHLT